MLWFRYGLLPLWFMGKKDLPVSPDFSLLIFHQRSKKFARVNQLTIWRPMFTLWLVRTTPGVTSVTSIYLVTSGQHKHASTSPDSSSIDIFPMGNSDDFSSSCLVNGSTIWQVQGGPLWTHQHSNGGWRTAQAGSSWWFHGLFWHSPYNPIHMQSMYGDILQYSYIPQK